jgi:predicted transcriptional regulator
MIDVPRREQTATTTEATVTDLFSLMELLRESRLARLYTYFLHQGPITVEQSIEELDMARSTAYKDVNRLAELAVLTKNETVKLI